MVVVGGWVGATVVVTTIVVDVSAAMATPAATTESPELSASNEATLRMKQTEPGCQTGVRRMTGMSRSVLAW